MIIRTGVVNGLRLSLKFSFKSYSTQQGFIFSKSFPDSLKPEFESSFLVHENFVSLTEEENLMAEFEPHLKRHLYEKDHWDNVSFLTLHQQQPNIKQIFFWFIDSKKFALS